MLLSFVQLTLNDCNLLLGRCFQILELLDLIKFINQGLFFFVLQHPTFNIFMAPGFAKDSFWGLNIIATVFELFAIGAGKEA